MGPGFDCAGMAAPRVLLQVDHCTGWQPTLDLQYRVTKCVPIDVMRLYIYIYI